MDSMARRTGTDPEVLHETLSSLQETMPFVIAECLARPLLTKHSLARQTVDAGGSKPRSESGTDDGSYTMPLFSPMQVRTIKSWYLDSHPNLASCPRIVTQQSGRALKWWYHLEWLRWLWPEHQQEMRPRRGRLNSYQLKTLLLPARITAVVWTRK